MSWIERGVEAVSKYQDAQSVWDAWNATSDQDRSIIALDFAIGASVAPLLILGGVSASVALAMQKQRGQIYLCQCR